MGLDRLREGRKQLEAREAEREIKKGQDEESQERSSETPENRSAQKVGSFLVKYQCDLVTMFYVVGKGERESADKHIQSR